MIHREITTALLRRKNGIASPTVLTGISHMLLLALSLSCGESSPAKVVTYPPPPGLDSSDHYAVRVNGQSIWTEKLVSNYDAARLPEWFTRESYTGARQEVNIANFSCSGAIQIVISASAAIDSFTVRPKSRRIEARCDGEELSFTLPGPDKLYIEINDFPALMLFANPLETEIPDPQESDVLYFGPGDHELGEHELKDNETIYIAGGAVVYGSLRGQPEGARLLGRGILDGRYEHRLVYLENASDLQVDGVILRNGRSWQNTLVNCEDVVYRNVKLISFGNSGDGINPVGSRRVRIDDCFFRCTDDCIAIKAPKENHVVENIRVINCTMAGYAFSDGVTIGFETNGPRIRDIGVENCDILYARGGSLVDGHSAFSIICDGPAHISDIHYRDIRVEEKVRKLFELHITDGSKYGIDPPGRIRGVTLQNVCWEVEKPILLLGHAPDHLVEQVSFINCTVAGRPLTGPDDPSFTVNDHVKSVNFRP